MSETDWFENTRPLFPIPGITWWHQEGEASADPIEVSLGLCSTRPHACSILQILRTFPMMDSATTNIYYTLVQYRVNIFIIPKEYFRDFFPKIVIVIRIDKITLMRPCHWPSVVSKEIQVIRKCAERPFTPALCSFTIHVSHYRTLCLRACVDTMTTCAISCNRKLFQNVGQTPLVQKKSVDKTFIKSHRVRDKIQMATGRSVGVRTLENEWSVYQARIALARWWCPR